MIQINNMVLTINNQKTLPITSRKKISELTEKSITMKVRKELGKIFENVKVSCKAVLKNNQWEGKYYINDKIYDYVVS